MSCREHCAPGFRGWAMAKRAPQSPLPLKKFVTVSNTLTLAPGARTKPIENRDTGYLLRLCAASRPRSTLQGHEYSRSRSVVVPRPDPQPRSGCRSCLTFLPPTASFARPDSQIEHQPSTLDDKDIYSVVTASDRDFAEPGSRRSTNRATKLRETGRTDAT